MPLTLEMSRLMGRPFRGFQQLQTIWAMLRTRASPEICEKLDLYRKFDACCATYQEIRKRGIRVVVGGGYDLPVTPMGQNARDIEHFVNYFGYSPAEALRCAAGIGAELMGMGDCFGKIKKGYLADLLLVKGDPVADVSLLQDPENLTMIMKIGIIHKNLLKRTKTHPS